MYKSTGFIVKCADITMMRGAGVAFLKSSDNLTMPASFATFRYNTHHNFLSEYNMDTIPGVSLQGEVIKLKYVNFQIAE